MVGTAEKWDEARRKFAQRVDGVAQDQRVDSRAGVFKSNAPDQLAQPPDYTPVRDAKGKDVPNAGKWAEEQVVMTKGELQEIIREALMQGKQAGSILNPENVETEKVYDDRGNFDDEAVNDARKAAQRQGDMTWAVKAVLRQAKTKKKFDPEKIVTWEDVQNRQYTRREKA